MSIAVVNRPGTVGRETGRWLARLILACLPFRTHAKIDQPSDLWNISVVDRIREKSLLYHVISL